LNQHIGFITVAIAGAIGVLRFGFSESLFAKANGDLADLAAFVGLPLVGYSFALKGKLFDTAMWNICILIMTLITLENISRSFTSQLRELSKIITNFVCFVIPVFMTCYANNDMIGLSAIGLFVFAGLVITADRHKLIFGVRCENWFHYCIGIAAVYIAKSL
jgi:hypothetical protein